MASSQQRKYANQIKPIRQNGHLLLVTLLLANMIVNESLPIISDPILGGGVQSVIVSTVLIVMCVLRSKDASRSLRIFHHWVTSTLSLECVLPRRIVLTQTLSSDACSLGSFAEIIPQSVCTRHGLYIGAKMVFFVRILLWTLVRLSIIVPCTCHLVQCRRELLRGLSRKSLNLYSAHIMASSTVALVCIFPPLFFVF
jgi:metal transporter CNNM